MIIIIIYTGNARTCTCYMHNIMHGACTLHIVFVYQPLRSRVFGVRKVSKFVLPHEILIVYCELFDSCAFGMFSACEGGFASGCPCELKFFESCFSVSGCELQGLWFCSSSNCVTGHRCLSCIASSVLC